MATYQRQQFSDKEIVVDGNRYESCSFINCRLIYSGGIKPDFVRCSFRQSNIQLDGAAYNTAQYMQSLYGLGLTVGAEKILNDIQGGKVRTLSRPKAPPPVYTGNNYGRLVFYTGILTLVTLLLGTALWYGYIYYPSDVVLEVEPARPLYDTALLDIYPVLPEQLAEIYDDLNEEQRDRLAGYSWVDQEGQVVRMPIEQAFQVMVDQNMLTQSSEGE